MFLVCDITVPCDHKEVWVDVGYGYWTIFFVSDSEALFWVSVGYFGWVEVHGGVWGIILGGWGIILGGWGWVGMSGSGCTVWQCPKHLLVVAIKGL